MTLDLTTKARLIDENIRNGQHEIQNIMHISCTKFKITTMTVMICCGDAKIAMLNLDKFKEWFKDIECKRYLETTHGDTWNLRVTSGFYNCVILCNHVDDRCIAVKIFTNGNLHITGIKSVQDAYEYGDIVKDILRVYMENNLDFCDIKVQMINGCFKVELPKDTVLCLNSIHERITQETEYLSIFNNDHYPGIRIKYKYTDNRIITIMVFESGSILINAFHSGDEMVAAYHFITKFIHENNSAFLIKAIKFDKTTKQSRKRQKFDYTTYL
jgi:TATA-box binding protein (TBP) (component of TFIID and TFIIIB)